MEKKEYRLLLSEKQYLKLLAADMVSRFGDSIDAIAYSWIMYEVTGSESLMALVIGLNYLPTVFLTPITGAVVDRIKKKKIMVISDFLRMMIVAAIILMYSAGKLTPAIIAALTVITSVVEAFRIPAGGAILPLLLDREFYKLGKAANYSVSRMAELIGYIMAGALIAKIGAAGALWIDALTFLGSGTMICFIRYKELGQRAGISVKNIGNDFKVGLHYIRDNKIIQTIGLIGLLINFGIMPLSVFQTPYVSDYLQMGPEVLSYIKVLMSVGMMCGAALVPKLEKVTEAALAAIAGVQMGITLLVMGITPSFTAASLKYSFLILSMFLIGAGGGVLNVIVSSCMMKNVPKDMMGRISGFIASIMQASMPAASFLCSGLALVFDVTQIFVVFGVITVIVYLALYKNKRLTEL